MSMQSKLKLWALSAAVALQPFLLGVALAEGPAPTDAGKEDAFVSVLPKVEVPENVRPIPGAVNEEFRNCRASWPTEYALSQKGPEARAYRDIYGFIKVRSVIESQDCSCAGKVANWTDVEELASDLRKAKTVEKLTWQQTLDVFETSNDLFPVAETMCGGSF
jgi:hypothetical protein